MINKRHFILTIRICTVAWVFLYFLYMLYLTRSAEFLDSVFPVIARGQLAHAYTAAFSFIAGTATSKIWSGVMLLLLCIRVLAPLNHFLIRNAGTVYAVTRNDELRCWVDPDGFQWLPIGKTEKSIDFDRTFFLSPLEAKKSIDDKLCRVKPMSLEDLSAMGFINKIKRED